MDKFILSSLVMSLNSREALRAMKWILLSDYTVDIPGNRSRPPNAVTFNSDMFHPEVSIHLHFHSDGDESPIVEIVDHQPEITGENTIKHFLKTILSPTGDEVEMYDVVKRKFRVENRPKMRLHFECDEGSGDEITRSNNGMFRAWYDQ